MRGRWSSLVTSIRRSHKYLEMYHFWYVTCAPIGPYGASPTPIISLSAVDAPPDPRLFWRKVKLSFDVLNELEENGKSALTNGAYPHHIRRVNRPLR